jgi:hypothetical protein
MTRGAMLIVKIMAFESLLLAVHYRSSVVPLAVESRAGREEQECDQAEGDASASQAYPAAMT